MPIPNNPPRNAIAATSDLEHRFHRLSSEWRLFPATRSLIAQDIANHPEWRIKVTGDRLVFESGD
ncbi:MAG: hypothetical protein MH252_08300 [Thermosynechococcaceae cyanobacterium MS004]|nr:hypothetical protein [Thermosynechococcaceae cyanobacterium MS004]